MELEVTLEELVLDKEGLREEKEMLEDQLSELCVFDCCFIILIYG